MSSTPPEPGHAPEPDGRAPGGRERGADAGEPGAGEPGAGAREPGGREPDAREPAAGGPGAGAREPGWYDDPDGRRRWWSGSHWGAYAPWGDTGGDDAPTSDRPQRPTLDRSLTFDPTAGGRASRAKGVQPERPSGPLPRPAAGGASPAPIIGPHTPRGPGAGSRAGDRPGTGTSRPGNPSHPGRLAWERSGAQPGRSGKQLATAYVLLIALGLLGGHRYYLGLLGSGIVQMMLSFAAAAALVVLLGAENPTLLPLVVPAAVVVWWVSDLVRLPAMVRRANR